MQVTITIPRFVKIHEADVRAAAAANLKIVEGIGSLFVEGNLDDAARFAHRFDLQAPPKRGDLVRCEETVVIDGARQGCNRIVIDGSCDRPGDHVE